MIEMSCMVEVGTAGNEFKWPVQDRSEWQKLVCAYTSSGAGSEERLSDVHQSKTLKGHGMHQYIYILYTPVSRTLLLCGSKCWAMSHEQIRTADGGERETLPVWLSEPD